jgi:hypothetical protein
VAKGSLRDAAAYEHVISDLSRFRAGTNQLLGLFGVQLLGPGRQAAQAVGQRRRPRCRFLGAGDRDASAPSVGDCSRAPWPQSAHARSVAADREEQGGGDAPAAGACPDGRPARTHPEEQAAGTSPTAGEPSPRPDAAHILSNMLRQEPRVLRVEKRRVECVSRGGEFQFPDSRLALGQWWTDVSHTLNHTQNPLEGSGACAPLSARADSRTVSGDHAHSRLRRTARANSRVRVGAAEGSKVQCQIPAS